jgi:hypothetical protein
MLCCETTRGRLTVLDLGGVILRFVLDEDVPEFTQILHDSSTKILVVISRSLMT